MEFLWLIFDTFIIYLIFMHNTLEFSLCKNNNSEITNLSNNSDVYCVYYIL